MSQGSVWCFESGLEQDYAWFLGEYIRETELSKSEADIAIIRSFWNDEYDWEEIVKKSQVEGSTWYVWWMDGVRAYICYEQKEVRA